MRDIRIGERAPIDLPTVSINVDGPQISARAGQIGAVLLALDTGRKVAPGFDPIVASERQMRPGAGFDEAGALQVDFAKLPDNVDRLMLILYIVGGFGAGVSLRDFQSLTTTIGDYRFTLDLSQRNEAALILVEMYRRDGGWRLAANGQGFVGGINAVASALGVDIRVPAGPDRPVGPDDYRGGGNGESRGPGTGSGFAINARHILTNAHVVDGAREVKVVGDALTAPAEVIFSDPRNDIALLRVERDMAKVARFRWSLDIHLGEDIVVLGFPLQGLLGSGPQATGGNVSSLCGIGNDSSVMQFTAPIASGNSGGPILDTAGLIIGQVHASLNLDRIRMGGGSAENINFGTKAPILRTFLATNGIDCTVSDDAAPRSRAEIVREGRGFIYCVRCDC
jgi:S1-C subfamily serine protease